MKNFNLGSAIAFWTLSLGASASASAAFAQPDTAPQNMVRRTIPPRARVLAAGPNKQVMQDLLDFTDLLNAGKVFPEGQKWVYGARIGLFGANQWAREANLDQVRPAGILLQIVNLTVAKIDAETATATVTYALVPPVGFQIPEGAEAVFLREGVETLQLKLGAVSGVEAKKWQIVPPDMALPTNTGNAVDGFEKFFSSIVYMLAQKPGLKITSEKAKASMTNMKQLSLGVLLFAQDFNDRYAFAPEYLQEALTPYIKSQELFFIPGTRDIYSFNANLSDKSLAQVNEVAQTVLFYEGTDEKPTFRYDGRAAICFADGHVKLVSPDEAKTLIWKP